MIVPNRHLKSMESLNDAELLDMNKTLIKIKSKLKRKIILNYFQKF